MVLAIFKIALRLRDRHVLVWQSLEIFNVFNTVNLKQIFWKKNTSMKKLLEHRFLFESTKIENATFLYKIAISETTIKTNRLGSIKWTYHERRNFASNYFIFWKYDFYIRNFCKELILYTNYPNFYSNTFRKRCGFILGYFFPVTKVFFNKRCS